MTAFQSEPSFLEELPENVIEKTLFYLGWMHLPSLEAVSNMSRAMFLACRQHSLWRNLCCQMQCLKHGTQAINQKNDDSWRLQMIMRPAFRTDGIYISKITYLRQGYQESAICQPSHLVTYYRYLRFFNGPVNGGGLRFVTSYVSTESPKNGNVIEQLREVDGKTLKAIKERIFLNTTTTTRASNGNKSNRNSNSRYTNDESKANLFIGSYWSKSDRLFTLLLFDGHSRFPMRLKMTIELGEYERSGIPSYRTAKCLDYCGMSSSSRERINFDIHNWGKFYFSRVKSYT